MCRSIVFAVVLLAFSPDLVFSQDFGGGIHVGMCTSQIDGDRQAGYNKLGLVAGPYVTKSFTDKWKAQFEMHFIQKGAVGQALKVRLNYIGLAAGAGYQFWKKVSFEAGVEPSFLLKATCLEGYWREVNPRKIDVPLYCGCNFSMTKKLLLNARFSYSSFADQRYYNNAVQFAFYYKIK